MHPLRPLAGALLLLAMLVSAPSAWAQDFPKLTARVVDQANLLPPADEAALDAKLAAFEARSQRQLVVATVSDLGGRDIAEYGTALGRAWGIGQKDANNGAIFLIAPNDRRMRIEVGYGLEPVLTDALSGRIIRDIVTPAFKAGNFVGGINGGTDAIITQIELPPEEARARAVAADANESGGGGGSFFMIFWVIILFFVILPILRGRGRGKKHRRRASPWGVPVIVWGSGSSGWGSGGGSSWGGGGFGGFSGGGGSFGGGGASGGW